MELIDRDELIDLMCADCQELSGLDQPCNGCSFRDNVATAPKVDAMPVVHGKWIPYLKYKLWLTCSVCEKCYVDKEWVRVQNWCYCPCCGAYLKGENDNDNERSNRNY